MRYHIEAHRKGAAWKSLQVLMLLAAVIYLSTLAFAEPAAAATEQRWLNAGQRIDRGVNALLSHMTLKEKVQLMYGVARPLGVHHVGYVRGVERLDVPPLLLSDGPIGVRDSCYGGKYPNNCKLGQSTALPATVSLAASFNPSLARDYGKVLGEEARARGVNVLYGPAMDIVRVPQGGRNFEYFSEDPYLTGQMATSWVKGLQSQGVAAQAKHYALNNQELERHESTSNVSERALREIYLPAWRQVATAGNVYSLMCANNMANETYNCENVTLLREILKGEWNWPGVVGSDYEGTHSAIGSVNGGLDQAFTGLDWGKWYSHLPALVRQGKVSEALIDEHVRRILRMMFRLRMFGAKKHRGTVDVAAHGVFARTVAERGAVLLKNEHNILPLDQSALYSIAVIGQYAATALTGGGGSSHVKPYYSISPVQGIRGRVGGRVKVTTADGSDIHAAARLARSADIAIVIANDKESEGADRTNIDLPGNQNRLIKAVEAANPKTVIVLNTGSAVTMPWINRVPALLEMWYAGEEDGNALAALLFGDVNPSGKLPITFPVSLQQDCCHKPPRYPDANGVYQYSEGLEVGYRWYDAQGLKPLFPFGYGLSYTTFRYGKLVVTPKTVQLDHPVHVSVRVTNTGSRAGTATPQVYLGFPDSVGEPPHRLVASAKVQLEPGQSRRITMTLPPRAFSYWNTKAHNWDVASGAYTVSVGSSSRSLPRQDSFRVRHADGVQGIAVQAPGSIVSGQSTLVTVTLTNTGDNALKHLHFQLRSPHGWSVQPTSQAPQQIPAHDKASLTYKVSAPSNAGPALWILTAKIDWKGINHGSATRAVRIHASPPL